MSRKAWLLTHETAAETKTIDVINARKKIGIVETYLGTLYEQTVGTAPEAVRRISGQEISLGDAANTMRAVLTEVDDQTLSRFAISDDGEW